MTQRVFVAALTVAVFLAGYAARVWTEPRRIPVPPAPAGIAREYARVTPSSGSKKPSPVDRAKLVAEIEKYRSQIDSYTAQVQEIVAEFDREIMHILTPAQREKYLASQKRRAEWEAKRSANRAPLTDEEIQRQQERPLTDIYWMVTVTPRLERLTKDYGLDAAQQNSVRSLLSMRRNKFIALFDSMPHPTIRLSRLAPAIERLSAPAPTPESKQ